MSNDRLRAIPLFADLPEADLDRISAATSEVHLEPGERLFEEGDEGRHAYVIIDGELEILKKSSGKEVLLAVRRDGDVIGEMSLLEEAPRMAGARAKCDTLLLDVPKAVFDDVLTSSAEAVRALFGSLVSRWRETEGRLRQREQLAQLGTLSAGLAHELNNPAAAAKRAASGFEDAARRLADARADVVMTSRDPGAMAVLADRLAAAPDQRLGSLARGDREEDLIDELLDMGVSKPSRLASVLVDVESSEVDAILRELQASRDPGVPAALAVGCAAREVRTQAGVALDAATRISDIVGAVKSYAFLDQAPVQEIDVHRGLDDTITLLAHELKDVEVVREYGDVPLFPAFGSELNQVWTNLIDNAVDAIREAGTSPGRITVRTRVDEDMVVVEVEDNGTGIPAEVLPRVFESFYTTKPPGEGTGLGLDISYGIVAHKHGGEIDIDSEPGRTTFRVSLPVAGPS